MTRVVLATMFVVGAGLQTLALLRYLRRASRDLARAEAVARNRGSSSWTLGDLDAMMRDIRDEPRRAKRDFGIDLAFIGGGAFLGALASILSLS